MRITLHSTQLQMRFLASSLEGRRKQVRRRALLAFPLMGARKVDPVSRPMEAKERLLGKIWYLARLMCLDSEWVSHERSPLDKSKILHCGT